MSQSNRPESVVFTARGKQQIDGPVGGQGEGIDDVDVVGLSESERLQFVSLQIKDRKSSTFLAFGGRDDARLVGTCGKH